MANSATTQLLVIFAMGSVCGLFDSTSSSRPQLSSLLINFKVTWGGGDDVKEPRVHDRVARGSSQTHTDTCEAGIRRRSD